MREHLPTIILVLMLLPGCTGEKDRKVAELTKKVEALTRKKGQDIFKKKNECKQYEESIDKNLSMNEYQSELLHSIFYSSKKNSCLMAKRTLYHKDNGEILLIEDILTHEQVWFKDVRPIQNAGVAAAMVNEQIKQLE